MVQFSPYLSDLEINKLICERIKAIRIARRITRKELAERSGVAPRSIANLEDGKHFSSKTLIPVLRVMDLLEKLDHLLPEPPATIKSLKEIKAIPPQKKRVRKSKAENG
ncbi:MAG: hypothetical protein A2583_11685 [Bdellovibrionales bacterium RIFOXYD1_FULL_53_11]|nr:MAG: hypothetical protein A2583_11685 [Bdellovibrionales bacterium RIFOXYD1_FULL_53_11]